MDTTPKERPYRSEISGFDHPQMDALAERLAVTVTHLIQEIAKREVDKMAEDSTKFRGWRGT